MEIFPSIANSLPPARRLWWRKQWITEVGWYVSDGIIGQCPAKFYENGYPKKRNSVYAQKPFA